MYESFSTHSSALILKRSTVSCFIAKSAILHKYARTNVVAVNIEGIAAVQHLISSPSDVRSYQGSLSPYIMYAGSAIVPSMLSREAHPRSTATGRRIVGVAIGRFGQRFTHKTTAKNYEKKSTSPTQPLKSKYELKNVCHPPFNIFVLTELQKANSLYEEKLKAGHAPEQTMFSLSWDIEELKRLSSEGHTLCTDMAAAHDMCIPDTFRSCNLPRKLLLIRKNFDAFLKRMMRFKWKPATHVFVLMISPAATENRMLYQ